LKNGSYPYPFFSFTYRILARISFPGRYCFFKIAQYIPLPASHGAITFFQGAATGLVAGGGPEIITD